MVKTVEVARSKPIKQIHTEVEDKRKKKLNEQEKKI
jgi:hypothetical protein